MIGQKGRNRDNEEKTEKKGGKKLMNCKPEVKSWGKNKC